MMNLGAQLVAKESKPLQKREFGNRLTWKIYTHLGVGTQSTSPLRAIHSGIWTALSSEFRKLLPDKSLTKNSEKREALTPESAADIRETPSPVLVNNLIARLAFSHIAKLIALDPVEKRHFYASQYISVGRPVHELRSQKTMQAQLEAKRRRLEPSPDGAKS
ncbi:hypothetical protein N9Y42_08450 [Mariniblastus sp.]|nr:hypothetical protein [Mariniblastus sp.]